MSPLDDETEELFEDRGDELVPALYARSLDEAEEFQQLLEDHGIEAVVGSEDESSEAAGRMGRGVPVLVPDALLDEASEIIADHDDTDEFEDDDEILDDDEDDEEEEFEELDEEPDEEVFLDEDDEDEFEDEDDVP